MTSRNQNPEQIARDEIDARLAEAGWRVQNRTALDFSAGLGIAVREYQTDVGPVDYVLFVDRRAVGVVEAKPEEWGHKITTVEDQSGGYAAAKLCRLLQPQGRTWPFREVLRSLNLDALFLPARVLGHRER